MPKVYLVVIGRSGNDVIGCALAEDGEPLGSHLSSSEGWLKADLESEHHQEAYKEHYPNGYEMEFVSKPKEHEGYQKALKLNHEKYPLPPEQ